MWDLLKQWFKKYFSDPQVALLLITVLVGLFLLMMLGKILSPILASLMIAYVLDVLAVRCERYLRFPRWAALGFVYTIFIGSLVVSVLVLLPLLWHQFVQLLSSVGSIADSLREALLSLTTKYPRYISSELMNNFLENTSFGAGHITSIGKVLGTYVFNSLPNLVSWLVYVFLVPLLVLFFLKDKAALQGLFLRHLPKERGLLMDVWSEVRTQVGKYIKGKVMEVLVVSVVTYIGFVVFNLHYALLLSVAVGLSSIIPYVGAVIVTVPVVVIGFLQFGLSADFGYMLLVYTIIQVLDGNLLVPILFSETMNLHPIAIIAAVLFFGSVWGFWGLFFAIPLATVVKAIIRAWLDKSRVTEQ